MMIWNKQTGIISSFKNNKKPTVDRDEFSSVSM